MSENKKKSFLNSFRIEDKESCARVIRNGGIAALISAAITTIFASLGFFMDSSDETLNYVLDPWLLLDVALMIVFAIFIFRKSRAASTLLVIHFILGKAIMWIQLGELQGVGVAAIFFVYYITAMRGTYIWHVSYRDSSEASPAPGKMI